ncbi:MAG TPA: uracil phosphoribosyltransferase [Bacteroidales bacterium]
MMIRVIGKNNSVFNQFMAELRDVSIQTDRLRFRRNLERLGEIFAYEISKEMAYNEVEVTTPLGSLLINLPAEQPVLATILRAGLPIHQGLLNYFDKADSAFISAYRKYSKSKEFNIKLDHISTPDLTGRVLIISDPMLATGGSLTASLKGLFEKGIPKKIHIVAAVASEEGINKVKRSFSLMDITFWLGAIDDELTVQAYIVPGLGDAGNLAYGEKDN